MIRKTIIVMLTLGAVAVIILFLVSLGRVVRWSCFTSKSRHVCVEFRGGNGYVHYVYSDRPDFLPTVDAHEPANPRLLRPTTVTYADDADVWPPGQGPPVAGPAMTTYALSHRFGCPLLLIIVLFASYPIHVPIRRFSPPRTSGFDMRIRNTTARMVIAAVIGVIGGIVVTFILGSALSALVVPANPTVPQLWMAILTYITGLAGAGYFGAWMFWRLTPGDHGGPLWRRRRRLLQGRGLCLNCGYNLTGNTSGVCPECGTKVEPP